MVSALPSQPDIDGPSRYVSFGPKADLAIAALGAN
jgi:hypothetical protein